MSKSTEPQDHYTCISSGQNLATLTAPQPDGLTVLLQLGDELVALLDHVCVLLVLIVRSVCLDDALDTVNGAGYAVSGDETSEVPCCC